MIVGRTTVPLKTLLNFSEGSLLELEQQDYGRLQDYRTSGFRFPLCVADIRANGKTFAKGEVCSVGNNWGVRVTEVLD